MFYKGKYLDGNFSDWRECTEKNFVKFLQSSAEFIYESFEIKLNDQKYKIFQNYKVPCWEVEKM